VPFENPERMSGTPRVLLLLLLASWTAIFTYDRGIFENCGRKCRKFNDGYEMTCERIPIEVSFERICYVFDDVLRNPDFP